MEGRLGTDTPAAYLIHQLRDAQRSVNLLQARGVRVAQEGVQLIQQGSFISLAFQVRRRPKEIVQGIPEKGPECDLPSIYSLFKDDTESEPQGTVFRVQ